MIAPARLARLRPAGQVVLLLLSIAIVLHGLLGPDLAPKNLATVLTWVHYRGLLAGLLLAVGNVLCGLCPIVLVRDMARRLHAPARTWPVWLRGKWIAALMTIAVLFAYELFDLWALPAATAWLVLGYFGAAIAIDVTFTGGSFCKHVCPVGQFSFLLSTLSPLEVKAKHLATCEACATADCVKGRYTASAPARLVRRGCELGLFLPAKVGNLDCTFCLDCVQACPHDNVTIAGHVPGEEWADDSRRSSIGQLSRRPDVAALATVFTFGALLNALAMTRPVYAIEQWMARALHTTHEAPVLAILFAIVLVAVPVALFGMAGVATRTFALSRTHDVWEIVVRYAVVLVPLGAGVWVAHYAFHFLTAVGTIVPVLQGAIVDATGRALAGEPDWRWLGLRPGAVAPLQVGFVLLGALGSMLLTHAVSRRDHGPHAVRAGAPWMLIVVALTLAALWILAQPMEMRGTALAG